MKSVLSENPLYDLESISNPSDSKMNPKINFRTLTLIKSQSANLEGAFDFKTHFRIQKFESKSRFSQKDLTLNGFFHGDAMAYFMNGAPFIQIQAGPGSAPAGGSRAF